VQKQLKSVYRKAHKERARESRSESESERELQAAEFHSNIASQLQRRQLFVT